MLKNFEFGETLCFTYSGGLQSTFILSNVIISETAPFPVEVPINWKDIFPSVISGILIELENSASASSLEAVEGISPSPDSINLILLYFPVGVIVNPG